MQLKKINRFSILKNICIADLVRSQHIFILLSSLSYLMNTNLMQSKVVSDQPVAQKQQILCFFFCLLNATQLFAVKCILFQNLFAKSCCYHSLTFLSVVSHSIKSQLFGSTHLANERFVLCCKLFAFRVIKYEKALKNTFSFPYYS